MTGSERATSSINLDNSTPTYADSTGDHVRGSLTEPALDVRTSEGTIQDVAGQQIEVDVVTREATTTIVTLATSATEMLDNPQHETSVLPKNPLVIVPIPGLVDSPTVEMAIDEPPTNIPEKQQQDDFPQSLVEIVPLPGSPTDQEITDINQANTTIMNDKVCIVRK